MSKALAALVVAVLLPAALLVAGPAHKAQASEWWCWDDPVLVVDGRAVHVLVGVPRGALGSVSIANVIVTVPNEVDAKLTALTAPRFPVNATIERAGHRRPDGSFTVSATVTVQGAGSFPTGLMLTQAGGGIAVAEGSSNTAMAQTLAVEGKGPPASRRP